ncbi:MAG: hypothetical protein MRY83_08485 [Flavobacteriales bacterium]|nr:hypothetical protein [Flavobacteriales bacterium]
MKRKVFLKGVGLIGIGTVWLKNGLANKLALKPKSTNTSEETKCNDCHSCSSRFCKYHSASK